MGLLVALHVVLLGLGMVRARPPARAARLAAAFAGVRRRC